MSVSLADIRADIGEVYDNINNGTTAVLSLIAKAESKISDLTGTKTGYDSAIRNVADAFCCNQILGSSSGASIAIGPIHVGRTQIIEMRDSFIKEAKSSLALKGYTLNTSNILFKVVNK